MNRTFALLGLAFVLALTACSSDAEPDAPPPPGRPPEGAPAAPPPIDVSGAAPAETPAAADPGLLWKDMDHDQRVRFMKSVVLPRMRTAFAKFDAEQYSEMKCVACHGDGAKDKTYKMPNPKLPRLPTDEAGWKKLTEAEPEAVKFMSEVVVPTMAGLLGEKPYDPATHQGFGCFRCHTPKK
jgi:cytochrome c553